MRIIKSVGVLSVAKIMGLIYATLGLIFMPFLLSMAALGAIAGGGHAARGGVAAVILAVMMPILYGAIGFIMGAIGALLYNWFARWVGGIEIEVQATTAPYPSVAGTTLAGGSGSSL
jgi:hypothetical protein